MTGALRESLVGPAPGASTLRPYWVQPADLAGCVACDTQVNLADVCGAVAEFMVTLSGGRYKQRRAIVRPKRMVESACWSLGYTGGWSIGLGGWQYDPATYALELSAPVQEIVAVKVDGVDLQPGDVALFDQRTLYRVDAAGARLAWPDDQRLDLPDTEPGTFSVEYVWGQVIPIAGQLAARAWACFMAGQLAALENEGDCALPQAVTEMVRQGTTLSRLSALDFLTEGKTGIDPVDQWVAMINPNKLRRPPSVASPDTMREVTTR